MYMLAALGLSLSSTPVHLAATGSGMLQVVVRVGAFPGAAQVAFIDLQARSSTIAPCPPHYSKTAANNTDVLYVAGTAQRVETTAASTVLTWDTLVPAKGVFGVCGNQLYLSALPRRCRTGKTGMRHCRRQGCNVNFAESHSGACEDGSVQLALGTYRMVSTCAVTEAFGRRTPAVTPGPAMLSIMRANLNFEYNDAVNTLTVWEQPTMVDAAAEYLMVLFLAFALAGWLGWSASLNAAQIQRDMATVSSLWERVAEVGLFVTDAAWLAASAKVYHVVSESTAVMPEAVDTLLGADLAGSYTVWYVGAVCAAAVAVGYIVAVAMVSTGRPLPKMVCRVVAPHVLVCRAGHSRLAALVTLRWMYEAILLTTLHLCTPVGLGDSFTEVVGAAVGLSLAAVSGRDAMCLTALCRGTSARVALLVTSAVVLLHVSLFMVYPCIASQYEADNTTVLLSATLTAQVSAGSALYHQQLRGPPHALDRPVSKSGSRRPGRF